MKYNQREKQTDRLKTSLRKIPLHILSSTRIFYNYKNIKIFNVNSKNGCNFFKKTPFINYKLIFFTTLHFIYPSNNLINPGFNCIIKEILLKNKINSLGLVFFNKFYFIKQIDTINTFNYQQNLKIFLYSLNKINKYFYYKISK